MFSLFYIPLIIGIITYEFSRRKVYYIDTLTIFNFFFCVYYLIPGTAISLFPDIFLSGFPAARPFIENNFFMPITIVSTYFLFILFRKLTLNKADSIGFISKPDIVVSSQYENKLYAIIILLLIVSWGMMLTLAYTRGGILQSIETAAAHKTGHDELVGRSALSFLLLVFPQILRFCCFLTTLLLFLYPHGKATKITLFVLSLIGAIIAGLMSGGRANVIHPLMFVVIAYLFAKQKMNLPMVIVSLVLALIFIYYGKSLYGSLSWHGGLDAFNLSDFTFTVNTNRGGKLISLIGELCPDYLCLGPAISNTTSEEWDCFKSLLSAPFYALPSSVFNFNLPTPITYLATYKVLGIVDYSVTYPGIIGYGFLCLSWFGFLLVIPSWGMLCGFLDRRAFLHHRWCAIRISIYLVFATILCNNVFFGNPGSTTKQCAVLIALCCFFLFFKKYFFLRDSECILSR